MSRGLPIFTIQTFNQNALQPAGAVFAQRVESISIGRSLFGSVAGGRNTMMEKKMNELTIALTQELDLQAKKMYPNAVALVDVELHFSAIDKTDTNMFLAGQASATALIKRVKPAGQSMANSPMASPVASPVASPMASPVASPMASPVASPMASPVAPAAPPPSAPAAILSSQLSSQNIKEIAIPKAISGGKKKSFISKARTNKRRLNRKD